MTNIDLKFVGSANFKQAQSQVAALERQFATLNAEMAKSAYTGGPSVNPAAFAAQRKIAREMQQTYSDAIASTGQFEVTQQRVRSNTQELIKDLQKQRLSLRDVARQMDTVKAAYREQLRLRRATLTSFTTDDAGNPLATLAVPKNVPADLDTIRNKMGMIATVGQSVSTQMVNWGKNTQWAGRQLTVGFTYPVALLAAASGTAAYQVDENLTRIAKVYDTQSGLIGDAATRAAMKETELAQLRADGLATASTMAKQYGAAAKDTLDVQAELAATGQRGASLQQNTMQVQKLALAGEMDYQTALKTSISLTEVFGMSSRQLGDTFAYMNSVENATSLSMEDFATAIPIASAAVQNLGGDVKDLGTMLTAMKARGIDASEGANAIKSAMNRIFRPTKQIQQEFAALTGESITELVRSTDGELIPTFQKIGEAIDGLDNIQRTQAVAGLFGTYQNTRLSALLTGMFEDYQDENSQVYRALEAAENSNEENRRMFESELDRMANSASGKVKRAWQGLISDLAAGGDQFLEMAAGVLNAGSSLLGFFSNLPDAVKWVLKLGLGLAAVAGPLLMLTGLTANLGGQGLSAISTLAKLVTRWKPVTAAETAAQLATDKASGAMGRQQSRVLNLTEQLGALSGALGAAARAQDTLGTATDRAAAKADKGTKAVLRDRQTGRRLNQEQLDRRNAALSQVPSQQLLPATIPVGLDASKKQLATEEMRRHKANHAAILEENRLRERSNQLTNKGIVLGGVMAATTIGMMQPWSDTLSKVSMYVMLLAAAHPALAGLRAGVAMVPGLWNKATAAAKAHTATAAGGAGRIKGAFAGIGSMINPWALALGAAAAGAIALTKHVKGLGKEIEKTYSDAEGLGKILGYTPSETVAPLAAKESDYSDVSKVKEFQSAYEGLSESIAKAKNEQDAMRLATSAGLKVINTGGTIDQANEAVRLALRAGQYTVEESEKIMLKFGVDFEDTSAMIKASIQQAQGIISDTEGNTGRGGLESFAAMFTNIGKDAAPNIAQAGKEALAAARESGKQLANAWTTGMSEEASVQKETVRGVVTAIEGILQGKEGSDRWKESVDMQRAAVQQLLQDTGMLESAAKRATAGWDGTQNVARFLATNINMMNGNMLQFANEASNSVNPFVQIQSLLNGMAPALGAANSAQAAGNSRAAERLALEKNIASVIGSRPDGSPNFGKAAKDMYTSSMTSAWSNVGSMMTSALDSQFSNRVSAVQATSQAAQASLEASHKRSQDRLESAQQKAQNAFERRWAKRKKALENEAALRKKVFDDEMKRIERRKQMQNGQTDYNIAMRTGDLDAAAKISTEMDADKTKWALEDQQAKEEAAYQRSLQRLADQEKKAKESLDRRLKREKAALDARLAREKSNLQASNSANQAAAQRNVEIEKAKFQSMLAADLAYTPKTTAEARRRITYLEQKYGKMGINLKTMGVRYGTVLQDTLRDGIVKSANEIKTKVNWAGLAENAASKYVRKIWGKSLPSFLKWVKEAGGGTVKGGDVGAVGVRHGGGPIGGGKDDRRGYAPGSAPAHSERLILAKSGEYMINDKAARLLGPNLLGTLNGLKNRTDVEKNIGGVGMRGVDHQSLAQMMAIGNRTVIKNVGETAKNKEKAAKEEAARKRKLDAGTKGGKDLKVSGSGWMRPWRRSAPITQGFHEGMALDYGVPEKSNLYAPAAGRVSKSYDIGAQPGRRNNKGYGSYGRVVETTHAGGTRLMMAHLDSRGVKAGQKISKGSYLGKSGNTGNSGGPHVHYMAYKNGRMVDPRALFRANGASLRKGGEVQFDNTMAELHRKEKVLTAPLSEKLDKGIERFSQTGGGNQYGDIIFQIGSDVKDGKKIGREAAMELKKHLDYDESRYAKK